MTLKSKVYSKRKSYFLHKRPCKFMLQKLALHNKAFMLRKSWKLHLRSYTIIKDNTIMPGITDNIDDNTFKTLFLWSFCFFRARLKWNLYEFMIKITLQIRELPDYIPRNMYSEVYLVGRVLRVLKVLPYDIYFTVAYF